MYVANAPSHMTLDEYVANIRQYHGTYHSYQPEQQFHWQICCLSWNMKNREQKEFGYLQDNIIQCIKDQAVLTDSANHSGSGNQKA